jgi:glycosyltransferase involved in cell wall biosynthesis
MRVSVATRIFAPEPAAASFRLSALTDALAEAGHAVKVVTTAPPARLRAASAAADRARRGVSVRRFPVLRDADDYVRGYVQYLSFDVPLFFRLLAGRRPAAIVVEPPPTTGFFVRLAAALRGVPYVYYAADIWSDATEATGAPGVVTSVVRLLERFALRGAAHVLAVSDGVAERVRALAGHERVTVVPGGIDTGLFTPDGPVDEAVAAAPVAAYTGTMSEWQGADVFVRALPAVLAAVPGARLVFAGQGSARAELEALAAELGVAASVEFTGVVPPADAARLLRSARVGLVSIKPGIGYDFAVPTKLFASAACGTPVLFAGAGAAHEVVSSSSLGATPGYDVAAVAQAMADALAQAPGADERERLAGWTRANASLAAAARAAVAVIESAAPQSKGSR